MKKIFLSLLIFVNIFTVNVYGESNKLAIFVESLNKPLVPFTKEDMQKIYEENQIKEFRLTAVGDLMVHTWQLNDAYNKETGEYDFSNDFEMVEKYLKPSDYTVGNLETVFGGKEIGYSDYPMFNTPDTFGTAIKEAGFDLLTTANNHSLDKREAGLLRTLDVLDELGMEHIGTYRSQEERDKYIITRYKSWYFGKPLILPDHTHLIFKPCIRR